MTLKIFPLNIHRTASNEITLESEIRNIIDDKNVIIATEQRIAPISILSDDFCEQKTFPRLLPKSKFIFNAPRDIPISPAPSFNQ